MKKFFALFLALCLALGVTAALAEEDEIGYYPDEHPESKVFDSVWVAEDGDWRAEVYGEDGGYKLMVVHRLEDKEDVWEYSALYDEAEKTLVSEPFGLHYTQSVSNPNTEWDTHYEDGEAVFSINENDKLIWKDQKEDAGSGLEFLRIGNFFGTQWENAGTVVEFYAWYEGEYDIRVFKYEDGSIADNAILKGSYNPETDAVEASGCFNDGETFDVTFSYNEDNDLVWSQDGVDTVFQYHIEAAD